MCVGDRFPAKVVIVNTRNLVAHSFELQLVRSETLASVCIHYLTMLVRSSIVKTLLLIVVFSDTFFLSTLVKWVRSGLA